MTTAAVICRSRTGKTRRYAEETGAHLQTCGVDVPVVSIGDCDMATLGDVDLLPLGCWTNGLFVVRRQPDQPWVAFSRDLPPMRARVGLFTTYSSPPGACSGA